MISFLLTLAFFFQGIPPLASESGTITGTLKTETGMPAAGVRIGAMAKPENATDLIVTSALASIAETDAAGHFRLENIPPGRYLITAGRVDYPTFFPGTQDSTAGKVVLVKAGDSITGIDFAMNAIATRPPDNFGIGIALAPTFALSIKALVEGGGLTPLFSAAGFTSIHLTRTTDNFDTKFPMNVANVNLALPTVGTAPDYRVTVENLPEGYAVKSIVYGTADITHSTLKLSSANTPAGPGAARVGTAVAASGATSSIFGASLIVTLVVRPPSSVSGVRVTGNANNAEPRSIYLSGVPGIFFSDGSFEFRGVTPGRYAISTNDNPSSARPQAASIVVGTTDVSGIKLVDTPVLPIDIQNPSPPGPSGAHAPGILPLAVVHGRILDAATKEPINYGTVYVSGRYGASYELDADGRFEIPRLLPGSYALEVHPFAHSFVKQTIVVGESDINLEIPTMELN